MPTVKDNSDVYVPDNEIRSLEGHVVWTLSLRDIRPVGGGWVIVVYGVLQGVGVVMRYWVLVQPHPSNHDLHLYLCELILVQYDFFYK